MPSENGPRTVAPAGTSALAQLQALAESQRSQPNTASIKLALPEELVTSAPSPLTDDQLRSGTPATATLDDVLATLRPGLPAPAGQVTADINEDVKLESLRLYASGKSRMLAGDTVEGLRDLETASHLNPGSVELLSALSDAQLRTGRRSTGIATLRRAVDAGLREPRALWLVARDEVKSGRPAGAGAYLANAWSDGLVVSDPALAALVGSDLGEALAAQGHALASATLLQRVIDLSPEGMPRTPSLADLPEALRRRGELRTLLGDQLLRLNRTDDALAAYRLAATGTGVDPAAAMARTVVALTRNGRPAQAALELLDDIEARHGSLDDRHTVLARLLANPQAAGGVGPLLSGALNEQCSHAEGSTPSTRRGLSRLAASCLGDSPKDRAAAVALLVSAVPLQGADAAMLGDMLDASATPEAARAAVRSIVSYDAVFADQCAQALAEHGRDVDANMAALSGSKLLADRLVGAGLLRRAGRAGDALTLIGAEPKDPSLSRGWLAMRALLLADTSDSEGAIDTTKRLVDDSASAAVFERALAKAEDWAALNSPELVVRSLAGPPDVVAIQSRFAAGLAAATLGHGEAAESLLVEAESLDDRDEAIYEALLNLYSPNGSLPASAKLTGTMRQLRQASPGSTLVRRIIAMDLAQKGLSRQAQPQLLSLVSDRGQPPVVLGALVDAWERAASSDHTVADEGEAWLRARLASRPQSSTFLLGLARILVAQGKAQEAADLLGARVATWPAPALLRQREFVLRDGLGKVEEADVLALARLSQAPPTLDNLLERAAVNLRAKHTADAARDITKALQLDAGAPRPEHTARIAQFLASITPQALSAVSGADVDDVVKCFSLVEPRLSAKESVSLALTRIHMIVAARPDDTDRIAQAILELRARRPQAADVAEADARRTLFNTPAEKPNSSDALRLLGRLALAPNPPDGARCFEWTVLVAFRGDGADLRWMLDQFMNTEATEPVLKRAEEGGLRVEENLTALDEHKAEIANIVAGIATSAMRDTMARDAHIEALKYRPTHPWVSNDYGFSILERGGDLKEAARLIEQAYVALPDSASVIDSLGWLRYKQGELTDDPARSGDVCKGQGAVSLLKEAARLDDGSDNAEVLDHLGDALWRNNAQGDRAEAIRMWTQAAGILRLRSDAARAMARDPNNDPAATEYKAALDRTAAKLDAVKAGKDPAIAPVGIPPTFSPRAEPPRDKAEDVQGAEEELFQP